MLDTTAQLGARYLAVFGYKEFRVLRGVYRETDCNDTPLNCSEALSDITNSCLLHSYCTYEDTTKLA